MRYEANKLKLKNPIHRTPNVDAMMDYLHRAYRLRENDPGLYPCAIILDLSLPKISGVDGMAKVREHAKFSDIPIIVISGPERERTLRAAVESGADGYLVKPFSGVQFCKMALQLHLPLEFRDTIIGTPL
jgi:DNA-binding response OmpR family regulator